MLSVSTEQTNRVSRLREEVLRSPQLCLERGYLMTESYRKTEGEPSVIRRAKALEKILAEMTIGIEEGELLVGRTTSKARGGALLPEVAWEWYLEEMDTMSTREWNRFAPLTESDQEHMRDFLPYWRNNSLCDMLSAALPQKALALHHVIEEAAAHSFNNIHKGHISPGYEEVLTIGLEGLRQKAQKQQAALDPDAPENLAKSNFYHAVEITVQAALTFARRYARLARELASRESDPLRRAELEAVADACEWVPERPARTFYEALQSVWLTYVVVMIEGLSFGIGFGRPDQYLHPFYQRDLAAGRITRERARELIALLYIKINSSVVPMCLAASQSYGGFPLTANITVGGVTADGRDAVNELSYLFLEAEQDARLSGEDIVVRVHRSNPDAFVKKAVEVAHSLRGKLKFVSDETIIQQLMVDGKPLEMARSYIIDGCDTPSVAGESQDIPGALLNLPMMLELALNNGVSRLSGQQIGPKTGDPRKFRSYDDVWNAYRAQVETLLPIVILFKDTDDQLYADFAPTPFQSCLFHACLEKGVDITAGGTAPYLTRGVSLAGVPVVGDSLAAIKKAVFETHQLSMSQLIDALDNNHEGGETALRVLQAAPKFGNDDDFVDSIVNEVIVHGSSEARKYRGIGGALTSVAAHIVTGDVPMGKIVGALPDGRRAGEPLSEGGISPYQGRNVRGPVSTLRSVAKLDHMKLTNGEVLNMRFDPAVAKDETKKKTFVSMLRTFLETGGALVQFNFVDTKTLREAQMHPETHRDLLVRVATYSAYFVELSPELQNDIIARMEFGAE
jgi:formate C-acetyltransferase